jgi:hypothetical protein
MKLKLFEEFGDEDYYKEITHYEYIELLNNMKLGDKEPKIKQGMSIKDMFNSMDHYNQFEVKQIENVCKELGMSINQRSEDIIVSNEHRVVMVIYKIDDDYYLVNTPSPNTSFWKCDQLDGLIRFIGDNF